MRVVGCVLFVDCLLLGVVLLVVGLSVVRRVCLCCYGVAVRIVWPFPLVINCFLLSVDVLQSFVRYDLFVTCYTLLVVCCPLLVVGVLLAICC